jgi:hypothetical protein
MLGLLDRATQLTSPQCEACGLVRDRKPGEGQALVTFVVAERPLCTIADIPEIPLLALADFHVQAKARFAPEAAMSFL